MASFIVGVMGKKRHGKDTFASQLVGVHGFTRVAFADPMRSGLYGMNPLVRVEADEVGPLEHAGLPVGLARIARNGHSIRLRSIVDAVGFDAAKETREVRRLLQDFGVGLREILGEDVWVKAAMAQADAVEGPVVITDVRFPNEVKAVQRARGLLVYVANPRVPDSGDTHVSETSTSVADADRLILNDGSLEQLFEKADGVALAVELLTR